MDIPSTTWQKEYDNGQKSFFSIRLRLVEGASIFFAAINKSNNFEFAESEFECL